MRNMRKLITLYIITLFTIGSAFAQTKVEGTVRDQSGDPLAGVAVMQKGTFNGTVTDANGNFSFTLSTEGEKVLNFNLIGHNSIEEPITNSKTKLSITMGESSIDVDEVVVVGFGVQRKATVTGALSSVDSEDLSSTPTSSPTHALTGRVSGLVTRQESGQPGADEAKMFVRGRSSFNDNSPLVLIDGIERSMSQINSEDIESISVLKDAATTAIYGTRGANGVVLVTTKRGKEGRTKINFSSQFGITDYMRVPKTLNAETVGLYAREGVINEKIDPSRPGNTRHYGVSEHDLYLYRTQKSPFTHPDNDFTDIFTKSGFQQRYTVNVSGGGKAVKYFVSVGYYDVDGMFETNVNKLRKHPTFKRLINLSEDVDKAMHNQDYDPSYYYKRTTVRSNLDINLTKDLTFKIDLSYVFGKSNRPGVYDDLDNQSEGMRLFGMFYRNSPQKFPLINENGSMAASENVWRQNPYVTLTQTGFRSDYSNVLETNFALNYNLGRYVKGLSVEGKFSYDSRWSNWWGVIERPAIYKYQPDNNTYLQGLAAVHPTKQQYRNPPRIQKYGELSVRYRNTFGDGHNVSGILLGTYEDQSRPGGRYSYIPDVLQGIRARANYDYQNRYMVEATMGYTGSNRFPSGDRYRLFPSVSVGWVPTSENFLPRNDALTFMKLRMSYGEAGNNRLGSFDYYYTSTYMQGENYSFGETWNPRQTGYIERRLALEESVTWEEVKDYNIGLDTRWLKDKINVSVDVFKRTRDRILVEREDVIIASGINTIAPMNLGKTESKGIEVEASYMTKIGDVSLFVKGIYSFAKNKIIEMGESTQPAPYMQQTGHRIGQYIGYKFDKFFDSYEEIAASPTQFDYYDLQPGDIKYKDINGDGRIDIEDQIPLGYSHVPEINYSAMFDVEWKGIGLSVLFQGAARSSVFLTGDIGWDNHFGNYYSEHHNRWTPETAKRASYPRFMREATANHQNYYFSDFWLYDGAYLRLKNIQLSYNLPKKWMKKIGLSNVKVYANAYNVYTWDNVKKVDPESPRASNGYFYPQQRVINFGLDIAF